jgi:hypothetical protein
MHEDEKFKYRQARGEDSRAISFNDGLPDDRAHLVRDPREQRPAQKQAPRVATATPQ